MIKEFYDHWHIAGRGTAEGSIREYLERQAPWGTYRTLTRFSFIVADMLESWEDPRDRDILGAKLCRTLQMCEYLALEDNSWDHAQYLNFARDPPWQLINERHKSGAQGCLFQRTRLLIPQRLQFAAQQAHKEFGEAMRKRKGGKPTKDHAKEEIAK